MSAIVGPVYVVSHVPLLYQGDQHIFGTARLENIPAAQRKILLFDRMRMVPISETRTNSDGSYVFNNIRKGQYIVVGMDFISNYHPDIARVQSEPM